MGGIPLTCSPREIADSETPHCSDNLRTDHFSNARAARSCAPLIGGLEVNSLSELLSPTLPGAKRGPPKSPVQSHLTIVAGHSPYEEPLLVLRIDDPEFFDCRFQC